MRLKNDYINPELIRDEGVKADLNGFFYRFKQPTERHVRKNILVVYEDIHNGIRLSYKAGGGSMSDNLFKSSLAIMEEDNWVTLFGRCGTSLADVIIDEDTFYEAESIMLTDAEKFRKRQEEIVEDIPYAAFVISRYENYAELVDDFIGRISREFSDEEILTIKFNIKEKLSGLKGDRLVVVNEIINRLEELCATE